MFLESIAIGKYKKLNNFSLEFKRNNNKIEGENFNLSVLIGENGTAKTTILQSISNILSNSFEKNKMMDYNIKYEINEISNIVSVDSNTGELPSKLIISSFTPIEKIYLQAKKSKRPLCPIVYSEMGKDKIKYIIGKYVLENTRNLNKMNDIVGYIGYNSNQYFLEFNKSIILVANLDPFVINIINGKFDNVLESILKNLNLNRDITSLILEYENNLDLLNSNSNKKTLTNYMELLEKEMNNSIRIKSRFSILDLQLVYLEFIYILLKMQRFSKEYSQRRNTNYKGNEQRLVDRRDLSNYFSGLKELEHDLILLEKFEKNIFNDIWFESNSTDDFVPLSYWSSGELSLFLRLIEISNSITENSIILIDEPETHLHPKWIKNYISILKDIIGEVNCHVIIATHAPLIVSDIPKECIVMLRKDGHLIRQSQIQEETIGLEYDEVLKRVFQVDESKGLILENYEQKIIECLKKDDFDTVVSLYNQLGDSPTKFDLFIKIKKHYEDRKRNK